MAEIKLPTAYRVDIIESERGWGSKIDEQKYFETEQEAREFAINYNTTHNTAESAPDWYMYASYYGKVN